MKTEINSDYIKFTLPAAKKVKTEIKTEVKKEPGTPKKLTSIKPTSQLELDMVKTLMSLNKTVVKKETLDKADSKLEVAKAQGPAQKPTRRPAKGATQGPVKPEVTKAQGPDPEPAQSSIVKTLMSLNKTAGKKETKLEVAKAQGPTQGTAKPEVAKAKETLVKALTKLECAYAQGPAQGPTQGTAKHEVAKAQGPAQGLAKPEISKLINNPNKSTGNGNKRKQKFETDGKIYVCKVCQQEFKLIREFEDHSMTAHTSNAPKNENVPLKSKSETAKLYVCNICQKNFKSINGFQNHTLKVHSSGVVSDTTPKNENIQVKSEVKSEIKTDIKTEIKNEIKSEIKTEIIKELLDEMDEIFKRGNDLLLQRKTKKEAESEVKDDVFKKVDKILNKSKTKTQNTPLKGPQNNSKIESPPKLNLQPALTPFNGMVMEVSVFFLFI